MNACMVCAEAVDMSLPSGCLCGKSLPACCVEHHQLLIEFHQQDPDEVRACSLARGRPL
jgi:hypothetical protein